MKVGILGLQGDVREHARALDSAGAVPLVVKHADEVDHVDALVVPGGESTTIAKLMDRFGLLEAIGERARAGMPVYGTCAGMILMARDLAGEQVPARRLDLLDIRVQRNAYGRQVDSFECDLDVAGLDDTFRAVFIRAPSVESGGPDVEVLATHEGRAVLVQQGPHMASSFHPEITGDPRIHEMFLRKVGAA